MNRSSSRIDLISDDPRDYECVAMIAAEYRLDLKVYLSLSKYVVPTRDDCWVIARLTMSDGTGEDLMRRLRAKCVDVPVIFLRDAEPVEDVAKVQKFGFHNVLQTPLSFGELATLIRTIAPGIRATTNLVQSTLDANRLFRSLDSVERDILQESLDGRPNKCIALHLGISLRTLERRRHLLMKKLGITSTEELVALAIRSQYAPMVVPQDTAVATESTANGSTENMPNHLLPISTDEATTSAESTGHLRHDEGHGTQLTARMTASDEAEISHGAELYN